MSVDSPVRPKAVPPKSRSMTWASVRPLVLRLHFYAGILIAPFLLVAATTGLLYACSFQAEKIVYSHELSVPVGETRLPLSQQVAAAKSAHPGGTIAAIRPAGTDDGTTRVMFSEPGLAEGHTRAVFVDPYTAKVRGELETYGSSGALPVRTWIDEFHRDLHLGQSGRLYSELAASWLWVVAGGGLILWMARRRRRLLLPERSVSGRRRTRSWHGVVGAWIVLGLFVLSATGLTWSKYAGENVGELRAALKWETPVVSASAGEHEHHGAHGGGTASGTDVGVDRILQAARDKGLSDPVELVPPGEPGDAYVVRQIQRQWPEKQDSVAVDPATGQVMDELRFADYPFAAKLTRWGIDLHTGLLFGLVNQLALAALALGLITVILRGYRMWWLRRPGRAFGRPMPRGAWRQVPWTVLVPLVAVTALAGWFLPLLGLSLLAFLLVDAAFGLTSGWRADRRRAQG